MQQNFEEVLGQVSGKYAALKPLERPKVHPYYEAKYTVSDAALWRQVTGVLKYRIKSKDFAHLNANTGGLVRVYSLIFVELNCEKNQGINDFIDNNYTQISKFCTENTMLEFLSLNNLLSSINTERIKYFRPYAHDGIVSHIETETANMMEASWYGPIRKWLRLTDEPIRGLMAFADDILYYYPLDGDSTEELIFKFVRALFLAIPVPPWAALACIFDEEPGSDEDRADRWCLEEFSNLLDEVQQKIIRMEGLGVARNIILSLLDKPGLSRMVITSDLRIYLPDFDNVEICIPPLAKALYLFYLKHPEGVYFKELRNHREELLKIYMAVSNRENYDEMVKSINLLVDSRHNCVNENRSRIRSAFLKEFSDSTASQYYITGYGRFKEKRVVLDRRWIIFECEI